MPDNKAFRNAIETAELNYKSGLKAIPKHEGKGKITVRDESRLLGSANIDADCLKKYPSDNRWDFVIGIGTSARVETHYVEVHAAETGEVSTVRRKLQWLKDIFLNLATSRDLSHLPAEYHWVASGKVNIPKHTPQYKILSTELRRMGLNGPVKKLALG